jgi:hypothetical protein
VKQVGVYRPAITAFVVLTLVQSGAWAQLPVYVAPGSTPGGDYLRGVGIAAAGIGVYNERSAVADQINANTFMTLNEYFWNVVKNENRENWEHRKQVSASHSAARKQIQERIHDHPEARDVMVGDALTVVLNDLLDPKTSDSSSRYAQVPLDADVIRRIPFKLGEKGETFSMNRLSLKGTNKWVVALNQPEFAPYRESFQQAVDNAIDLAIEGKMKQSALDAIVQAVDELESKVRRTPHLLHPINQRQTGEAKIQLDALRKMARTFQTHDLQVVFGEIDKYSGTTVDDLRLFMRRHKLTFAAAATPDERTLYPQLHTALIVQREKSVAPGQAPQK